MKITVRTKAQLSLITRYRTSPVTRLTELSMPLLGAIAGDKAFINS